MKHFSLAVLGFALCLGGCLPDEQLSSHQHQDNIRAAQVTTQTSAIMNIALMAQEKLTASEKWASGTTAQGLVNVAGGGGTAQGIKSAYCSDDTGGNAYSITWASKAGLSNGEMQVGLIKSANAENVMTYKAGVMKPSSGAPSFKLSATCVQSLSISDNAPVLVMALRAPAASTQKQVKVTFESSACGNGEAGYILHKVVETFDPSGSSLSKKSDVVSQNCKSVAIAKELDLQGQASAAIADTSGMAGDGVKNVIAGSLNSMNCLKAKQKKTDEKDKTKNLAIADTCDVQQVSFSTIEAIKDQDLGFDLETRAVVCNAGNSGNGAESYIDATGMKFWGTWSGTGTLVRKVFKMAAADGTVTRQYRSNDPWEGDTLNCQRSEKLEISCASMAPAGVNAVLVENDPFVYTRTLKVEGWSDKRNFIAAKPDYVSWNYVKGNCTWTIEENDEECKPGFPLLESLGKKQQKVKTSPGKKQDLGWTKTKASLCYNQTTESEPVLCTGGSVIEAGLQTRTNRNYDTGTTTNGAWNQVKPAKCGMWEYYNTGITAGDNDAWGSTKWYYIHVYARCKINGGNAADSECASLPRPANTTCVYPAQGKYMYLMYGPGGCGTYPY